MTVVPSPTRLSSAISAPCSSTIDLTSASQRLWTRRLLVPVYLIGAALVLPWSANISGANIVRLLTVDIVPFPLRDGGGLEGLSNWLWLLASTQAWPGAVATI